jgi:hypothetical protein
MKKILRTTIVLTLVTFFQGCGKKNFVPKEPYGSNTIECMVNDYHYTTSGPKRSNTIKSYDEVFITGSPSSLNGTQIFSNKLKGRTSGINIKFYKPLLIGKYIFSASNPDVDADVDFDYETYATYNGQDAGCEGILEITHLGNFVAGTFSFTAKHIGSEKRITITEGKFDIAFKK